MCLSATAYLVASFENMTWLPTSINFLYLIRSFPLRASVASSGSRTLFTQVARLLLDSLPFTSFLTIPAALLQSSSVRQLSINLPTFRSTSYHHVQQNDNALDSENTLAAVTRLQEQVHRHMRSL